MTSSRTSQKNLSAPPAEQFYLSARMLEKQGACEYWIGEFKRVYGSKPVPMTYKNFVRGVDWGLPFGWIARKLREKIDDANYIHFRDWRKADRLTDTMYLAGGDGRQKRRAYNAMVKLTQMLYIERQKASERRASEKARLRALR